jgi:hypothetical protein
MNAIHKRRKKIIVQSLKKLGKYFLIRFEHSIFAGKNNKKYALLLNKQLSSASFTPGRERRNGVCFPE